MMTRLAIGGYRSLRDITVTLGPLNVVTGANGSGKSSLYRALKLLADIAQAASSSRWRPRVACNRRCGPARRLFPTP